MLKFGLLTCSLCSVTIGQTPFVNFYWEASDGGAWTRHHLTTAQQSVQIRLVAEWGGSNILGFAGTGFDVTIDQSDLADIAHSLSRPSPFGFPAMTPAVMRINNVIKLDDSRDTSSPGEGIYWIQSGQASDIFGTPIDPANPAIIFRFDMELAPVQGTRHVNSIHQRRVGPPENNAALWSSASSTSVKVLAPINGVDIALVPAPGSIAILTGTALWGLRRRRFADPCRGL